MRILLDAVAELVAQAQQVLCAGQALLGGLGEVARRLVIVPLHPGGEVVERAEVALGHRVILLGRLLIELDRHVEIRLGALPRLVADAEVALRRGIAHVRRLLEQLERAVAVALDAGAVVIADAQPVAADRIVRCRLREPLKGLLPVALDAVRPVDIVQSHLHLCL